MCKKVTAEHSAYCDLTAYYRFDENSSNILTDYIGTNNGPVSGASWVRSAAPVGDDSPYAYAVTTSTPINKTHSNGDEMTVNVTAGTADAIHLYRIDEEPEEKTPSAGLDQLSETNYWGVKTFGSSGAVYEVVYNYDGNPGIEVEANLRLSSRADNCDPVWTTTAATVNESNNTLTLPGQTGTQFILGSTSGNPFPVELLSFNARIENTFVKLDWQTVTEEDHDYFEVERSKNGRDWESVDLVSGAGNSATVKSYSIFDKKPIIGKSYYRLKIVALDQSVEYSDKKSVTLSAINENEFTIYPNPADDLFNVVLDASAETEMTLTIFNEVGTEVLRMEKALYKGTNQIPFAINYLSPGLYYISILQGEIVVSQKLIVR